MAVISKDLGAVTAYAAAVEGGYTGTKEEFETLMASYATVAEEAAESAESASASATSASGSAQTATQKASEASTSATQASASATSASQSASTATAKASEASASASTAGTKASEASTSATTASTKASEASASATSAQTAQGLAESARDDAVDAKTDAESARDLAQQYAESIDPENIFSAYATDTASGAVATFADGADDIPMKSVKVAIEPVQDLHGQEAPYPAGTTANLFKATPYGGEYNKDVGGDLKNYQTMPYEITSDGRIVIDVQTEWRGRMFATDVLNAGNYVCEVYLNSGNGRLTTYITDSNLVVKSVVFNYNAEGWSAVKNISVSDGDRIAVFIGSNTVGKLISEFQVESGTTIHDIVPFENICPISGWTGAQVVRCGKNLFDGTFHNLAIARVTGGTIILRNSIYRGLYARVAGGHTYTISRKAIETNRFRVSATIDEPEVGASTRELSANSSDDNLYSKTVTVPEGYNYLFVYLSNESATCTPDNYQIELGSTATEYEPYTGDTYSITFPSEAGTVYGGELDVTNGVLTVDRAFIASYNGETLPSEWISDRDKYVAGTTPTTGAQVCYKLSQAVVYTLTPTEIKSLLGDNNIWADAGDTSVTYRADTAMYIDKKIAEVINALS